MSRRLTLERSVLSYCQSIWDGRLFKFNDLPEWMKDNEYITDMHRPQVRKFSPISSIHTKWAFPLVFFQLRWWNITLSRDEVDELISISIMLYFAPSKISLFQIKNIVSCLRSIFSIHAETGNIWTHLIGALVFLVLIIFTLSRSSEDFVNPFWEKFVFTTFLACAFLCLRNSFKQQKSVEPYTKILKDSLDWSSSDQLFSGNRPILRSLSELPQCANIKTDNLVDPDEDQSLNDTKFFNSFSYAWMQYGGNLCILWPLRLHWNCNFDHWKFSTMGLLFILLPTKNTICIYYYYSYTRVSQSRVLTHVGTILKYFSSLDETFC